MPDKTNTIDPLLEGVDVQKAWRATCVCGRDFSSPSGYSTHVAGCSIYRRRLAEEQQDSKQAWEDRNRGKTRGAAAIRSMLGGNLDFDFPNPPAPPQRAFTQSDNTSTAPIAEPLQVQLDNQDSSAAIPGIDLVEGDEARGLDTEALAQAPDPELGRGLRAKQTTKRLKDFIPNGKVPLGLSKIAQPPPVSTSHLHDDGGPMNASAHPPALDETPEAPLEISAPCGVPIRETTKDRFGLYKRYQTEEIIPHDPDAYISLSDLQDDPAEELVGALDEREATTHLAAPIEEQQAFPSARQETTAPLLAGDGQDTAAQSTSSLYPYPNESCFSLGQWFWGDDAEKSAKSFQTLVSIVGSETFKPEDVRNANWAKINRELGSSQFEHDNPTEFPWYNDGTSWASTPITIDVPFNTRSNTPGPQPYTIKEFRYRPLVPLIRQKLENVEGQQHFHFIPHELRWQAGPDKEDVRVHCELYQSEAFLEAYEEVQVESSSRGPDDNLPRCVVGLMFGSDATMLAHFGDAKLWPLYLFFGNDSKYRRCKTSLELGEQVAYFEKLPDEFKDWVLGISGQPNLPSSVLAHCHRELLHAQLRVMFDDEFMHAYEHGIVIVCADGIKRRFYPRILTYSADYPEKVSLAGIKNLGACPCTRCAVQLKHTHRLGMVSDRRNRVRLVRVDDDQRRDDVEKARAWIHESHYGLTNDRVENLLNDRSLVPARNAFSERLSPFGFNLFDMLTSDVMHEVELGVWKSLFIQLLRMLEVSPSNPSHILDSRFRQIPTFGKDTIRRFRTNTSEMKQLAARDYEDMLQCAIPVFEGLFENANHGKMIRSLLFILAHWHGLAKLRTHTDHTLQILDDRTTDLGAAFRKFVKDRREAKKNSAKVAAPPPPAAQPGRISQKVVATQGTGEREEREREPPDQGGDVTAGVSEITGVDIDLTAATLKSLTRLLKDDLVQLCESRNLEAVGRKHQLAEVLLRWRDSQPNGSPPSRAPSAKRAKAGPAKKAKPTPAKKAKAPPVKQTKGSPSTKDEHVGRPSKRRKVVSTEPATSSDLAGQASSGPAGTIAPTESGRKPKTFSLHNYKFHALGHVVTNIRRFGCSDNYSTEGPESYHRAPKRQYKRTSKKRVTLTLSRIQTRQARIRRLRKQLLVNEDEGPVDPLFQTPYFIGQSQNNPVSLASFLTVHREDPATRKFLAKLRAHLLPRIRELLLEEARVDPHTYGYALPVLEHLVCEDPMAVSDGSITDRDRVYIDKDRLYRHEILNVNFTSYEGRREQDILNPKTTRRDFMCLREDDQSSSTTTSPRHRFCYGRLLGIYHVNVVYLGAGSLDRKPRRIDVLWVRWFKEFEDERSWTDCQLDRLGFYPLEDINAVDFVNPAHVLRACHLIPRFVLGKVEGRTLEYSPLTQAHDDWAEYMINRFVDRDMMMRYHWGLAVGHIYSHSDAPKAVVRTRRSSMSEEDESDLEQAGESPHSSNVEALSPRCADEHGGDAVYDSDGSEHTLRDREDELAGAGGASEDEEDEVPEPDE
ncbi:hypothetical protein NMY22_g3642 [Coprinellus aureogranulatus]|nr:hypothetical protein NMY22_g3642 [Coprinellus aureogranulatus]